MVSSIVFSRRLKHTVEHHLPQLVQAACSSWRVPIASWQVAGSPELRGILPEVMENCLHIIGEPLSLSNLVEPWLSHVPPSYASMATLSLHIIQCLEREEDHHSYLWEARKHRAILEERRAQMAPITPQRRRPLPQTTPITPQMEPINPPMAPIIPQMAPITPQHRRPLPYKAAPGDMVLPGGCFQHIVLYTEMNNFHYG